MLTSLRIKNLALVEDLTWELGPGLVCVTGETGAGKSMIVGALKLILGERADRGLIRTGEESCIIEAVFQLEKVDLVNAQLVEAGLEPCEGDELIIKRQMTSAGQNRQWVNLSPATLGFLKDVGRHLVDLHGPHDQQSLLSRDRQMDMLDACAGAESARDLCRAAWQAWREVSRDLEELRTSERASESEIELLRHQVTEIEAAQLKEGEEEALLQRYKVAANSSRLTESGGAALQKLADDDDSVMAQLRLLQRTLRDLERLDPALHEHLQSAERAFVELEELESSLRDYLEGLELDPQALAALEDRINLIESLKRKYGGTVETVMAHHQKAATRLSRIENRGDEIVKLEARLAEETKKVTAAAKTLSALRAKAAPKLATGIASHLLDLGFKRAMFEVQLAPLPEPGAHGAEDVDFLFAPNPGEPSKPLRLVASSGEMSRVMLAVKSALAREDSIPLLVFDEIDANVGGEIAAAVGRKMATLGVTHQVLSITHMPQVAALAACHYEVTKDFSNNRTRSLLRPVEGEDRVTEIARMLGGSEDSAKAHARSLLEDASGGAAAGKAGKGKRK